MDSQAPSPTGHTTTVLLTSAVLVCFAANSLLCRMALATREIDASSFTALRLVSGAVTLLAIASVRGKAAATSGGWTAAVALFLYAAPFSLAYLSIGAGVGALVLFGAVQLTMFGWSLLQGEWPSLTVWLGLALALGGLAALTLPGAGAPSPVGVAAMAVAGLAWGAYSLLGRTQRGDQVAATAGTFVRAAPMALALAAVAGLLGALHATPRGVLLALISGMLVTAGGYTIWFRVLPRLPATTAAVVQLLVPVLAGLGGAALLGEKPSLRLLGAGFAILGGVVLAILGRRRSSPIR